MRIEKKEDGYSITDFNEFQAYKIAAKIEKDGISFYIYLSINSAISEMKEIFEFLAGEEKRHLRIFEAFLDKLSQEKQYVAQDNSLLNIMDTGIFKPFHVLEKEAKGMNTKQCIQLAIDVEIGSINFYRACLENVAAEAKKELLNIIEEEKKHESMLEEALSKVA